jgi:hypothetical protein
MLELVVLDLDIKNLTQLDPKIKKIDVNSYMLNHWSW